MWVIFVSLKSIKIYSFATNIKIRVVNPKLKIRISNVVNGFEWNMISQIYFEQFSKCLKKILHFCLTLGFNARVNGKTIKFWNNYLLASNCLTALNAHSYPKSMNKKKFDIRILIFRKKNYVPKMACWTFVSKMNIFFYIWYSYYWYESSTSLQK